MTLLPPLEDAGLVVALVVVPPQTVAAIVVTRYLNSRDVFPATSHTVYSLLTTMEFNKSRCNPRSKTNHL